jgi:hypothetical protein
VTQARYQNDACRACERQLLKWLLIRADRVIAIRSSLQLEYLSRNKSYRSSGISPDRLVQSAVGLAVVAVTGGVAMRARRTEAPGVCSRSLAESPSDAAARHRRSKLVYSASVTHRPTRRKRRRTTVQTLATRGISRSVFNWCRDLEYLGNASFLPIIVSDLFFFAFLVISNAVMRHSC